MPAPVTSAGLAGSSSTKPMTVPLSPLTPLTERNIITNQQIGDQGTLLSALREKENELKKMQKELLESKEKHLTGHAQGWRKNKLTNEVF